MLQLCVEVMLCPAALEHHMRNSPMADGLMADIKHLMHMPLKVGAQRSATQTAYFPRSDACGRCCNARTLRRLNGQL